MWCATRLLWNIAFAFSWTFKKRHIWGLDGNWEQKWSYMFPFDLLKHLFTQSSTVLQVNARKCLFYIICLTHWLQNVATGWTQRLTFEKHKNSFFLMSVASLYTPCFVMFCVFLFGPFCHGAHKLDLSTLFTTFFLWTSLLFIFWMWVVKDTFAHS